MNFVPTPMRVAKLALFASLLAATACSGGGSTGSAPVPNTQFCGNDAQYAVNPQNNSTFAAYTQATIQIAANGNNNQIYQSYKNFDLILVSTANGNIQSSTGSLSLTGANPSFTPFSSNYYYNGTLQSGVAPGVYNVYVNSFTSNCTPIGPIGQLTAQ